MVNRQQRRAAARQSANAPQPAARPVVGPLFAAAVQRFQAGDLKEANRLCGLLLAANAQDSGALHLSGLIACRVGMPQIGVDAFRRALAAGERSAPLHHNLAEALRTLGELDDAIAHYREALDLASDFAAAHTGLGSALMAQGRLDEAVTAYLRALDLDPAQPVVRNNLGTALHQQGRLDEALAAFEVAIALNPSYPAALVNCGKLLAEQGRHDDAIASYDRALGFDSGNAELLCDRAASLRRLDRLDEALASYEHALAAQPDYFDARQNRGQVLSLLRRPKEALAEFDRALLTNPDDADVLTNRGSALFELQRWTETLASCDRALAIAPDHLEALHNRGSALIGLGRFEEALSSYDRALALKPDQAATLNHRGNALLQLERVDEAAQSFARTVALDPDLEFARGNLFHAQLLCCDWSGYDEARNLIASGASEGKEHWLPFMFQTAPTSAAAQLACNRAYSAAHYPRSLEPLWRGERYRHDRVRIAYLSADFRNHPVAYSLVQVWEGHDRTRFETAAISFGPLIPGEFGERLERAFDRFIDARDRRDGDIAALLREREVDIAIDLMGYTSSGRPGIFALRPVPIQATFLGYAGTTGADYIDYIVADQTVIPEDERRCYSEHVAYLPDTFMPFDGTRQIAERTPSRHGQGLPETGFVFCSFNNTYKLTPPVFDVWMRLLHEVEGSVLWLSGGNPASIANRRDYARQREIDPDRLIFASRTERMDDHLARHRLAGLFLDTLPYNAHVTAAEALWTGLPIVTCLGTSYSGRVAASLLQAVGLPELVTENLEEYETLALKLARDPALLGQIKAKLAGNRATRPLFDTARYTRHLESAYETMWQRYQRGEPPAGFAVPSLSSNGH
jgi:protein O-GlcNAc transferase